MAKVYNRIYSKEKWDKVNEFNKNLLDDYILQIRAEGKTEGSIKQYYNDARIILIYIMEQHKNKDLCKLTRKSFRNFILWMQDNGLSPARINRLLVTSRNMLNFGGDDDDYAEDFEECKINPTRIKGMAKEERREIVFLEDKEIMVIYDYLIKNKKYSQALLCALMYDSSCRRNEAFQVKRDSISLDSNITKNEVIGKRRKKFKLLYNDLTKEAYKLLEESREDDSNDLWMTSTGQPAAYETLYNWVISWRIILENETGVYKEFNPHSFRHSSLTNLKDGTHYIAKNLNKKFGLQELKLLAHHEDISTTDSYIKNDDEDKLMEAFNLS